jgi:hypothetical protein
MVNTFSPFGFRQFGTLEGNGPTYGLTRRYLATSDTQTYFTGDVVQLSTGTGGGLGFITQPSTGGPAVSTPILGIFAGCEYYNPSVGRTVWSSYFPGNTGASSNPVTAYTIEGEDNLFLVQCTTTQTVGTSQVGSNFGFTTGQTGSSQTGGNTTTGISNIALLSSVFSALSSQTFRLVDTTSNYFPPGTNGSDGTNPGAIVLVSFNNQMRRTLTGPSS